MEKALYREMYEMETRHWWFLARRRIVLDLLMRYLTPKDQRPRFLDLGCGTGSILQALEGLGEATGMDLSEKALEFAATRTRARLLRGSVPEDLHGLRERFDAVLMLDLLEHLDEDKKAVAAAADLLVDGGILLLTVPAYEWLYSPRDRFHHHRRRYSRREVREMIRKAGLSEVFTSYYNCFLFPLAAAQRLWCRFRGARPGPDLRELPRVLNSFLEDVFAAERFLLGRVPLPWGLSVVAVARKGAYAVGNPA
ncbi:class I SAM-dependent methyltransferase [Candidatus Solincola tengchongensis]|uniref:class I SAM-dependent methyltransferase n=1 Tax=Candidatus Solincola tengchongensis TaxID=2900693 RepID=UPI00257A717F